MNGKLFTDQEKRLIHKMYPHYCTRELAQELHRSEASIYRFAHSNGLLKSIEYMNSIKSGRFTRPSVAGMNSRYKKGHVPYNKGKKQIEYMSSEAIERTKATRFVKGALPHNTNKQGDGAITIRTEKTGKQYKYIRIGLGHWQLYHQYIWCQEYGKYDSNTHCLWFINGNSLDVRLDNIELITRRENAQRNAGKFHSLPPELKHTNKLIKQIKSKIHGKQKI
jgi:hypothetical protein